MEALPNNLPTLVNTRWLSQRLGLSVTTIERLRAQSSADLPPHIVIGGSIRYDALLVEQWIRDRLASQKPMPEQYVTIIRPLDRENGHAKA